MHSYSKPVGDRGNWTGRYHGIIETTGFQSYAQSNSHNVGIRIYPTRLLYLIAIRRPPPICLFEPHRKSLPNKATRERLHSTTTQTIGNPEYEVRINTVCSCSNTTESNASSFVRLVVNHLVRDEYSFATNLLEHHGRNGLVISPSDCGLMSTPSYNLRDAIQKISIMPHAIPHPHKRPRSERIHLLCCGYPFQYLLCSILIHFLF